MNLKNTILTIAKRNLPNKVKIFIKSRYFRLRPLLAYFARQLPMSKEKTLQLIDQLHISLQAQQNNLYQQTNQNLAHIQQQINQLQILIQSQQTDSCPQANQNSEQINTLQDMIWQQAPSYFKFMETMFTKTAACYNVLFMISDVALWDAFESIYRAFAQDPAFNALVIVTPRFDITPSVSYQEILDFFKNKKINYIAGYSPENDQWIDLTALRPHLVFYTVNSWTYGPEHKIEYVSAFARTCYIPYGFLLVDQETLQYNSTSHKAAWRIFCETSFHQEKYKKYHPNKTNKIVVSGYPKFDYYQNFENIPTTKLTSLWKKSGTTESKKIIWAPHWTVADISPTNCSNFDTYYLDFLEYAKKTQHIQWLYKPHPGLLWACELKNILTKAEFDDYFEQWQNLPNGQTNQLANYFDYFVTSDALILDSISFIAEYLPTKKPVLFLEKPGRPTFNAVGEKLLDSFYKAFCFQDVIDFVEQVVIKGNDLLYDKRMQCLQDHFYFPQEGAGTRILNYIKTEFGIDPQHLNNTAKQHQHNSVTA